MQSGSAPPASEFGSSKYHESPYECAECEVVPSCQQDLDYHIQNCAGHGSFQGSPHQNNVLLISEVNAGFSANAIVNHDGSEVNTEADAMRDFCGPLHGDPFPTAPANSGIWDASHQSISEGTKQGITNSYPQPTSSPNSRITWDLLHPVSEQPGSTLTSNECNLTWPSVQQYECPECNVVFSHQSYLERHRQSCGGHASLNNNAHQKNFILRTNPEIDWPSNVAQSTSWSGSCGKEFSLQSNLQQHECHSQARNELKCSFCSKKFNDPHSLEEHHEIHIGGTVHPQRVVCVEEFSQRSVLTSQLSRKHTDKVRLVCGFCPVTFDNKEDLERHHLIHTQEGRSGCPECPKTFRDVFNLRRHLATHTSERLHECRICHLKFKRKDHFNVHIQEHYLDEEGLFCPKCMKYFFPRARMAEHLLTHHARPRK